MGRWTYCRPDPTGRRIPIASSTPAEGRHARQESFPNSRTDIEAPSGGTTCSRSANIAGQDLKATSPAQHQAANDVKRET